MLWLCIHTYIFGKSGQESVEELELLLLLLAPLALLGDLLLQLVLAAKAIRLRLPLDLSMHVCM